MAEAVTVRSQSQELQSVGTVAVSTITERVESVLHVL